MLREVVSKDLTFQSIQMTNVAFNLISVQGEGAERWNIESRHPAGFLPVSKQTPNPLPSPDC